MMLWSPRWFSNRDVPAALEGWMGDDDVPDVYVDAVADKATGKSNIESHFSA